MAETLWWLGYYNVNPFNKFFILRPIMSIILTYHPCVVCIILKLSSVKVHSQSIMYNIILSDLCLIRSHIDFLLNTTKSLVLMEILSICNLEPHWSAHKFTFNTTKYLVLIEILFICNLKLICSTIYYYVKFELILLSLIMRTIHVRSLLN